MSGRSFLLAPLAVAIATWASVAQAATTAPKCTLQKVAELPVVMAGMKPMVAGKIDGFETRFMADSGAFYSSITPAAAERFKMSTTMAPRGMAVRGAGGTEYRIYVASAKEFDFADAKIRNVQFLVVPGVGGGDVAGLLGQNVLSVFDTEYDLGNGVIRLMKPMPGCEQTTPAYWAAGQSIAMLPISWTTPLEPHLIGHAQVNGQDIKVMFDTGASYSVLKLPTAERLGFRREAQGVLAAGVGGGIGPRVQETWAVPFTSFDVGGEQIKNARLRVADLTLDRADMLLGADFFLSHRVYVSKLQHKIYFTYSGGPVFRFDEFGAKPPQTAAVAPAGPPGQYADAPTDAAGFTRRGEAFMSRRNFAAAIADFGRAVELEPTVPQHFRDRARGHLAKGEPLLALADFDQALKLKADDAASLIGRGELFLATRAPERAKADFDAALRLEPDRGLQVAAIYSATGHFEAAVAGYDAWIAAHPRAENPVAALNGRCWARTLWNRDLDKALADCDAALRHGPRTAGLFDSRGLTHLRRGELDAAIADYNEALKLQPKLAWSLYGRGLAERGKGLGPAADSDIAAAVAIQPNLPVMAKRYGLGEGAAATAAK
jgi:tetratricopeptide (TPR) repeat protein